MARIAIDARKYFDFGIGTYIQCLVEGLSKLKTPHTFSIYVSPDAMSSVVPPEGWTMKAARYGKYSASEFLLFGLRARRDGVELFHEPHYTLPLGLKRRSVATVHDLIHLRLPQYFSSAQIAYARFMIAHALHHAGAVLTASSFSREEMIDRFGMDASRVIVVPLGIRNTFQPETNPRVLESFRSRHGLARPYILSVGNTKPHKNTAVLLEAFKAVAGREEVIDLVFVGESLLSNEHLRRKAIELDIVSRIHDLGRLPLRELATAYSGAEMFVFPSEYEGFGLPVVEAMASGTPVIISDAAALVEVAGEAALITERGNRESLAHEIDRLLHDSALREEIKIRGRKNASRFSWDRTAEQTLAVYDALL